MTFKNTLPLLWLIIFVGLAATQAWQCWHEFRGFRGLFGVLGCALFGYGAASFYATRLAATHGLPADLEWPVGTADQIIPLRDGKQLAVHSHSARIQVYDREWGFLHGWSIPGACQLKAKLDPSGAIEVWSERTKGQKRRHVYSAAGSELSAETYAGIPADVSVLSAVVPTAYLLYPFTDRLIAWGIVLVGSAMWWVATRQKWDCLSDSNCDSGSIFDWDSGDGSSSDD